jgi:hypothetical protein
MGRCEHVIGRIPVRKAALAVGMCLLLHFFRGCRTNKLPVAINGRAHTINFLQPVKGTTEAPPPSPRVVFPKLHTSNTTVDAKRMKPYRLYLCGKSFSYPHVAKSLFKKVGTLAPSKGQFFSTDILVHAETSTCPVLQSFPGKVLRINCESNSVKTKRKNHFILGPIVQQQKQSMLFYCISRYFETIKNTNPEWISKSAIQRLPNSGKLFLIFIESNCVKYRDTFFRSMIELGMRPSIGGRCAKSFPSAQVKIPHRKARFGNPSIYQNYRFALCMENKVSPGYITEKLLLAFIGGGIPIYSGTQEVFNLFNRKAFVYYDANDPKKTLDKLTYLESHPEAYKEMQKQPILANGTFTLEKYFSLDDDVGNGLLRKQILKLMDVSYI